MNRYLLIAILLLPPFAGCTVGPDYHAPRTELNEGFGPLPPQASSQPYQATTLPAQTARWWTVLEDCDLDSLINQAIAANRDLRIAAAHVQEARAMRNVAVSGLFPTINAGASYTHERVSKNAAPYNAFDVPGFPWEFNLFQPGFDASWELDVFGGVRRSVEAADADIEASVAEQQSTMVTVLAETARNYVELRKFQQQIDIANHNLDVQRETLELTNDRASKGVATQLDVFRASAQVSTTEAALPRLRNLQWQAMYRLAVLTGQQPGVLVQTLSPVKPLPSPPAMTSIGLPAELLRRRPDIRRAERELAAATARIGVAVADLYPKFSLTGSFYLQSSDVQNLLKWDSRSFGFGPAVQWPIFDAGRLRAAVKVRSAQQEQALNRYEQTVLQSLEEVQDALVTFATEQDRCKSLQAAVKANQESTELAKGLYLQGLTDFTIVLDAQRQLYLSQEGLLESRTAVTTSLIAMYKALGGGWETEQSSTENKPKQ